MRNKILRMTSLIIWLLAPGFLIGKTNTASGLVTPEVNFNDWQLRFTNHSIREGLSQNSAKCLLMTASGFLMIGTESGLNRFDGYEFQKVGLGEGPCRLSDSNIVDLVEDQQQRLWVATDYGLNMMEQDSDCFTRIYHRPGDPKTIPSNNLTCMMLDQQQRLWIGTHNGLCRMLPDGSGFEQIDLPLPRSKSGLILVQSLLQDSSGGIWIGSSTGACYLPADGKTWSSFQHDPNDDNSICSNWAETILETPDGLIWIGTDQGLNSYDPQNGKITRYLNDPDNPNSLAEENITALINDPEFPNVIWIGLLGKGLNLLDYKANRFFQIHSQPQNLNSLSSDSILRLKLLNNQILVGTDKGGFCQIQRTVGGFRHYFADSQDPDSLNENVVYSIYEDKNGGVWVGTDGGGVNYLDPQSGKFTHYKNIPEDPHSLSSNYISNINADSQDRIWVCTYGQGINYMTSPGHFERIGFEKDSGTLADSWVYCLLEDRDRKYWIGTWSGLNRYDLETKTWDLWSPNNENQLSGNTIYALIQVKDGGVWVGTENGINRIDPQTQLVKQFTYDPESADGLRHRSVRTFYQDPQEHLWFGSNKGLGMLNLSTEKFISYDISDGLPNNTVYGIVPDDLGYLWLSTNQGLSRFNPKVETFDNYDFQDGLQSNEFNSNAWFRGRSGLLYFGGINGFNVFDPARIRDESQPPILKITHLLIADQEVSHRDPGSVLSAPIYRTSEIALSYDQDMVSFKFAALDYLSPEKVHFAYRLHGFDKEWRYTDAPNRQATYTNLPHGDYTFQVKGANNNRHWNLEGASIHMIIRTPPWLTWWAKALYLLTVLIIIQVYANHQKKKLAFERSVVQKLQAVDRLKDEFLANTSHELRTPLHGMIGVVESLLEGVAGPLPNPVAQNLELVLSSGRRLTNLVNDVLDFSRLRSDSMALETSAVDLASAVEVVLTLCQPLAAEKDLLLINEVSHDLPPVQADENRLQQILYNLIGNAIKFTDSGHITVNASEQNKKIIASVADTGPGISPEDQERIFQSFEQGRSSQTQTEGGTGLGLAISRKLVKMHGGQLKVSSVIGEGSVFSFDLNLANQKSENGLARVLDRHPVTSDRLHKRASSIKSKNEATFNILVVDDDPINLQVVQSYLAEDYNLLEARDGEEALELFGQNEKIDLVLLDIMMPGRSGYEICQELRTRFPMQELPIILLTARNRLSDLASGFTNGANDYLTKPFFRDELRFRVRVHLELLNINRNLEKMVRERTHQLSEKNETLALRSQEIMRAQSQLIMQETMASMGTLSSGIAHELRNPLNFINNFAQTAIHLCDELGHAISAIHYQMDHVIRSDVEDLLSDLTENAGLIAEYGKRAGNIVTQMIDWTSSGPDYFQKTDFNNIVEKMVRVAVTTARFKDEERFLDLSVELDPRIGKISMKARNMGRVIMSLVNNAVESVEEKRTHSGNEFLPQVRVTTKDEDNFLQLRIWDNGVGIAPDQVRAIFNPFHTSKADHIGLGLSISYNIVTNEHHGEMSLNSQLNEFSEFIVRIPKSLSATTPISAGDEMTDDVTLV